MYSTVEDLARWTHALIDRQFGSKTSVDAMLSPQASWCDDQERTLCPPDQDCQLLPLRQRACRSYGYGWELYTHLNRTGGGERVIEHGGASEGFLAASRYYPDRKLYLVILTNSDRLDPGYLLHTVWDAATTD